MTRHPRKIAFQPGITGGAAAIKVSDLRAEVAGHVITDGLGQTALIRHRESRQFEIHVEALDLRISFWLSATTVHMPVEY
jgi:hypothetical protein